MTKKRAETCGKLLSTKDLMLDFQLKLASNSTDTLHGWGITQLEPPQPNGVPVSMKQTYPEPRIGLIKPNYANAPSATSLSQQMLSFQDGQELHLEGSFQSSKNSLPNLLHIGRGTPFEDQTSSSDRSLYREYKLWKGYHLLFANDKLSALLIGVQSYV